MKTLHTIYMNFAKRVLMSLMLLMTVGVASTLAQITGTLGSINSQNGTFQDNLGNSWTVTTIGGTPYGTSHGDCYQIGNNDYPATSITFQTKLPEEQNIISFKAKFGGYNDTEGLVVLKVGDTEVGRGNLNGDITVTITNNRQASHTDLTVTVTDIEAGVNFYDISYTYGVAVTHEVEWVVDDEPIQKEIVVEGNLTQLPPDPFDCSEELVFVGWTTQQTLSGDKPADLFNSENPHKYPFIDANKTFYAVYATPKEGSSSDPKTDKLTRATTGITGTTYSNWTNKKVNSAIYAGNSAGGNSSIQLRSTPYSGIITTASGGKAQTVVVEWNSNTTNGRILDVYGKHTAYSSTSELYDDATIGDKLGAFTYTSNAPTTLELPSGYEYIGLRSHDGAMYLTSISITWKPEIEYSNYTTICSAEYTVTLVPNGGTGNFEGWDYVDGNYTKTVEKDQSVTLPTLDRIAYTFGGWYDENDNYIANGGDNYTPEADITLYAHWTIKPLKDYRTLCTYDILLDKNNTDAGSVDGSATVTSTYTLLENITAPTRTGYSIEGYYAEEACTKMVADGNGTLQSGVADYTDADGKWIAEDIQVLYTKWTANTNTPYVVEHYQEALDGSYTLVETDALTGTTDAEVTPARKTYEGFTSPDPQTVKIAADGSLVVKYQYTRKSYLLTWDLNGGNETIAGTPAGSVKYGAQLTAPQVKREGYTFAGWDLVVPATMPAQDVTYVAQWRVNTHTVIWNPNGGNWGGSTASIEETYSYSETINIPDEPTRAGYTFNGWSPTPAVTMPAANQTYTAQWNCVVPTIHIEGEYVHFPGDDITLTVVGENIADDATYVWKQGETLLPDQTTATLTINHCDVKHAGNYVCTVTNGTCSAEANFTVKIFHLYGLKDNTWTQPYVFMKDAEANKAILYVDLDAATSYEFKLINGREWYWNEGTMTYDNCTNWDMPQEGDVKYRNTWITTTVAGTYAFKLDYTDAANLKLSVVYPQKKMVYLNPGPWDVANAKFAVHTWIGDSGADLFMEKVKDCAGRNIYQAEIDAAHANIIFVRVNPAISDISQLWQNEWNRTSDLTLPTDEKVMYDMTPLFLSPTAWNSAGAWFAAYFYGNGETWKKMTDTNGDGIFECEKPSGYSKVIFCRMDKGKSALARSSVWNQTGDLTIPTQVNNHFIVPDNNNAWNKPGDNGNWSNTGMWTTFTPYHTISYNMNGHGTQISDECIKEGNTWSAPTDPTEDGYTFQGWRRPAATGDSKLYKNGQTGYTPTASETLTAQWQINQCVVTWKVNAQEVTKTTVDIANPLTTIPYTPEDDELGCCAEKFIGWSTETNPTKSQVYTTASELQNLIGTLTANTTKTFHAVFATPVPGAGTSLVTFSEMGYANEEAVTSVTLGDGLGNGDATITFAKGTAATYSPTYYTIGEAVRTYAGNTITVDATYASTTLTQIDLTFAKGENANTITASTGTITDGKWTGNAPSVTFTIGGDTGHRRIASIAVTTDVTGDKYTNYVTKCDLSNSASIGVGTITYANSATAIDTKCGQRSPASKAATLTFASAQNLTCPVTIEATTGFLVSTNRNDNSKYASSIIVKPVKSGTNKGKLPTIYVRYEANFGATGQIHGTITATGSEIVKTDVAVLANVTCTQYTLTVVDHLGNTISTTNYYEGNEVAEIAQPTPDDCSKNYTFDGWSTEEVTYGSLIYNKVSFPFVMPAEDVTLYPVYQVNDTEDYHRVTYDLGADNWAGDYVIAYYSTLTSELIVANGEDGGNTEGGIGYANNVGNLSVENDIISKSLGNQYYVTLEAYNTGYLLKTQDGEYNYHTTNSNTDLTSTTDASTAAKYLMYVSYISADTIQLCLSGKAEGSMFRYYVYNGKTYFRFCKPGAGYPIRLYKKSPLYTTPLICGTIEAEDAVVTSTAGQTIKVNVPVTLTSDLTQPNTIEKAISDNPNFSVTALENAGQYTIAIGYTPTATTDGTETANITLTASNNATTTFQVTGRHLPENFVIATKVGATWYALPADMSSATNPVGVVIEVDETTMTATAPNTTSYTLFPVKTTNTQYDRFAEYGDRVRFSAVNNGYKGLWANNSKTDLTINNDMVINQASAGQTDSDWANNSYYEWKVTTTVVDGHWQYTLQTDQEKNQNFLRYWTSAEGTPVGPKWGTYNAGENKLYFLPVTETQPFEYAVVEWYPTKVLIQTDAAIASPTVKVGGEKVASPILTSKGGKLYEISNLPLETNPNKLLQVSFTDDAINYTNTKVVPIILSREAKSITGEPFTTLTQKVYQYADVVVRDGATLSIDGATDVANTLLGVTIYPTAKVSVDNGKKLSVHNLTFFGGIDEIYNGSSYEINKYGVPQLSLKGILNKTVTNMDYIMRVDLKQMYQVGVPYDVNLYDITYWDGTAMTLGDNLYVSAYDGQKRANLEPTGSWVWEVNFAEKVLKAGIGYTISADMQAGVGNEYSIIRMPMKSNVTSGNTEAAKTVQVYAYANEKGVEITDNNKGWNYLSNPYMAAISGAEADSKLVVGYLDRNEVTEPWEWVNDTYRYVTIPSDDGTYHYQQKFSNATLYPFKSFFLQIATSGELSFALASRQSAPARYLQTNNEKREVEFEVVLANDTRSDNLGLLISEAYTPAYEINADLEKMIGSMSVYTIYNGYNLAYNALSPANAEEQIPIGYVVPTVGEYTWALDESSNIEDVEHIYLIDYETSAITDLVTDVYTFTASEQKSDTRFAINVTLKSKESTVTGLVNVNKDSEQSLKFIHNDKIYILHNGVIYDATGKFVETINK